MVIQDVPRHTNIIINGSRIRYNYLCFGVWTMIEASNAFINLHDHVFITTKSQEADFLIKPMPFQWFHNTACSETYEHRRHLEPSIDQKGIWLLMFFFIFHVPKVTPKNIQSQKNQSVFHSVYKTFWKSSKKMMPEHEFETHSQNEGPPLCSHSMIILGKLLWLQGGEETSRDFQAKCPQTLAGP